MHKRALLSFSQGRRGHPWSATIYQQLSPAEVRGQLERVVEQLLDPFPQVAEQHDERAEARRKGKSDGTEFAQPLLRKSVCSVTFSSTVGRPGVITRFVVKRRPVASAPDWIPSRGSSGFRQIAGAESREVCSRLRRAPGAIRMQLLRVVRNPRVPRSSNGLVQPPAGTKWLTPCTATPMRTRPRLRTLMTPERPGASLGQGGTPLLSK